MGLLYSSMLGIKTSSFLLISQPSLITHQETGGKKEIPFASVLVESPEEFKPHVRLFIIIFFTQEIHFTSKRGKDFFLQRVELVLKGL